MITVIENPIETSYEEAVRKYEGYCIGMQVTDACEFCTFKVKVMLYSDKVPDEEFMRLEDELNVTRVMWADPDGMRFPTREEHESAEAKYERNNI